MSTANGYREALGIPLPRLEVAPHSPDANTDSLQVVALLERGPLALAEVARRFEEAGVAPADAWRWRERGSPRPAPGRAALC